MKVGIRLGNNEIDIEGNFTLGDQAFISVMKTFLLARETPEIDQAKLEALVRSIEADTTALGRAVEGNTLP